MFTTVSEKELPLIKADDVDFGRLSNKQNDHYHDASIQCSTYNILKVFINSGHCGAKFGTNTSAHPQTAVIVCTQGQECLSLVSFKLWIVDGCNTDHSLHASLRHDELLLFTIDQYGAARDSKVFQTRISSLPLVGNPY